VLACVATGTLGPLGSEVNAAYYTIDGGEHWSRSKLATDTVGFLYNDVQCPTVEVCYTANGLATSPGTVLLTRNGGVTWSRIVDLRLYWFGPMSCPSTTLCVVSRTTQANTKQGDTIDILSAISIDEEGRYEKFGPTLVVSGSVAELLAISCQTSTSCMVSLDVFDASSSSGSYTEQTVTGGATWTRQKLPGQVSLTCLWCKSPSNCVGVGFDAKRTVLMSYGS
jgi:hypothetical protein